MRVSRWLTAPSIAFVLAAATAVPQPAQAREIVGFSMRYPVGVGRAGRQWSGATFINDKALRPTWVPPPVVRRDKPNLPNLIPGGAPNNPLGAAVMTLAGGEYAIHGTNNPGSIGGSVSNGCIRMFNADVLDLYGRVGVGTAVIVTR